MVNRAVHESESRLIKINLYSYHPSLSQDLGSDCKNKDYGREWQKWGSPEGYVRFGHLGGAHSKTATP